MKNLVSISFITLFCLAAFGCNSKSNLNGLVSCEGKVTFKGEACSNARISFSPTGSGGNQRAASGTADSSGAFTMTTLQSGDGVFPGEYSVTITKYEFLKTATKPLKDNEESPPLKQENKLPEKYADTKKSGLTITIPESGTKNVLFELQ
ncbi:MAG: carboxypeptidase-like regulatory domain-containing protein [Planctomycetaceae bacterium]|jgi:hypothetical protein|nr:carboxypeptidase-like regulatory domain-containing protein [Planctomycetaceae bacterium]